MTMGMKIYTLRKQKGYTQEELGKLVGVGRAAINKYEKGTVDEIGKSMIKKLADALSTSPSYLIDDSMESPLAVSSEGDDPVTARIMDIVRQMTPEERSLYLENLKTLLRLQEQGRKPDIQE